MAYVNKGMTDSGGGSSFNYKAPVSSGQANRNTQTRFEQQQRAAEVAAQQRAQASLAAAIRRQREQAAIQAAAQARAEAEARARAEAELKRKALELKNWQDATSKDRLTYKEKAPVAKQSFWDKAKGIVADLGNPANSIPSQAQAALAVAANRGTPPPKFFQNTLPSQARDALAMSDTDTSLYSDLQSYYKKSRKNFDEGNQYFGADPSFLPTQARDAMRVAENRFSTTPTENKPFTGRGVTVNENWKRDATAKMFQDQAAGVVNKAQDWSANKINKMEDQAAAGINTAEDLRKKIASGELAEGIKTNAQADWEKFQQLSKEKAERWKAALQGIGPAAANAIGNATMGLTNNILGNMPMSALSEFGYTPPADAMKQRPPIDYQSYASFMQPHGPRMPGENEYGPLQDRFTGEDKLSYQSRLPSYWEGASADKLNFYRYAKPQQAAEEAEVAYQAYATKYKDQYAAAKAEDDKNAEVNAANELMGVHVDRATENMKDKFDPGTGFADRLTKELSGKEVPSYTDTWQDMRSDRVKKEMVSNELTRGFKDMLGTRAHPPSEYVLSMLPKFRVETVEDYYNLVWNQDDPNTKLGPNTRMIGATDPRTGQFMVLPIEYFLGDRSMWDQGLMDTVFGGGHTVLNGNMFGGEDTALTNPRRAFNSDANDLFLDYRVNKKIDRGWAVDEQAPVTEDQGGYGDGGYGGYGSYGSGGSYWSPAGYYDNQFAKDRYGSFQNLAKWVI